MVTSAVKKTVEKVLKEKKNVLNRTRGLGLNFMSLGLRKIAKKRKQVTSEIIEMVYEKIDKYVAFDNVMCYLLNAFGKWL